MIEETKMYCRKLQREFAENMELSGLSENELLEFLASIPFSNNEFNRFLKGSFHGGKLNLMYKEYLESIGK